MLTVVQHSRARPGTETRHIPRSQHSSKHTIHTRHPVWRAFVHAQVVEMVLLDCRVSLDQPIPRHQTDTNHSIWNVVTFISLIATYFRLHMERVAREKRVATLKSIDYMGMFLFVAGCALL